MALFGNPFRLASRMRREQARLAMVIEDEYKQQNWLLAQAKKVVDHVHEVRHHLATESNASPQVPITQEPLTASLEIGEPGKHQHAEVNILLAGKMIGQLRIHPRIDGLSAYKLTGRYHWFLRRALNRLDRLIARKEVTRRILLARAQPVIQILNETIEACPQDAPTEIRPEYYPHSIWSVEYDRVIIWVRQGHHRSSVDVYTRHYTLDDHNRFIHLEDMVPALRHMIQKADRK